MVNWSKLFSRTRRIPSVGMPGMMPLSQSDYQPAETPQETPPPPPVVEATPQKTPVLQETPASQENLQESAQNPVQEPAKKELVAIPAAVNKVITFFEAHTKPLTEQEKKLGIEAHRIRLANVTSSFEAPINPKTQMPDKRIPNAQELASQANVPLLMPSTRFYWCSGDQRSGLTVGYGTFFTKKRKLIPEDQSLLPSLKILNTSTNKEITEKQAKANVIHDLFPHIRNDARLKNQPYHIPVASADALLRARFNEKTKDLDRLLSNKGKRKVMHRSVLVDWVASDLYYQGALSHKTGTLYFAANQINKQKLSKKPDPTHLRLTARRTCADLKEIIDANPFKSSMSEDEKQIHARHLAEYCTAYAAHQMTRANPQYYYTRNHVQAHIQDLSSLATMDIARNYYGRDLTKEEVLQCSHNAAHISERIFSAENPQIYALRLSVARESEIKNPRGHYRASPKLMSEAREKEKTPIANEPTQNKQLSKQPNLTARLHQGAQQVPSDLPPFTPSKESERA